jgi:hypothetical protein
MSDATGDAEPAAPPRDWKKLVIVTGLGALSWVATYVGMLELIEANMGDLPIVHKLIIGFSVAMLMTMIVWLLDQIFSPIGFMQRLSYIAGYVFLSIISIGFGFGFYWKVLESRSEASRSAESAVTAVQSSLNAASTRLEQLNATLLQLAAVSKEKAEIERNKGTSCPNSKPGDGPRRRMRDDDAARFSFASDFVAGRVGAVKGDISALDTDLAKIAASDPSIIDAKTGTRNEFMKALSRKLDMTVSSFNALRTDPQLKELRADLSERSEKSTFGDPKSGGFQCPDTQLSQALRGAVRAINELPVLEKPVIAAVEGSEATIEAFRRLTATFYGLLAFKLPPSADELRELQKKAMQSLEGGAPTPLTEAAGLSKRDYVPLAIAIFVDICLLLVSIGRPMNRLHGLMPKMREAERGPVIEILSRFNDIHRDEEIRESFELFRHVVFDVHGAYYVAVPLDAPPRLDPREREDLRVEVQLLANLFTSFEQDRIFRRTWTPFTGTIRSKLRKQGSKFAGSDAFRVYRFRDGAWSEIILGAVMGAARRAEAEAQRRRVERDLLNPGRATLGRHEPYLAETAPYRTSYTHDAPSAAKPREHEATPDLLHSDARSDAHQSARFAAQFGAHARRAEKELRPEATEPTAPRAANSNTAPALSHPVVPRSVAPPSLPAQPVSARHDAPANDAKSEASVLVAERAEPARERIDLVLKRETATLTLPVNAGTPHEALIGRMSEALGRVEDAELADADRREAQNTESFEEFNSELASDPATADAIAIAGRLRPAVSGDRS